MIPAAVLTVSDRSFSGEREDLSGPAVTRALREIGEFEVVSEVVPDDRARIAEAIRRLAGSARLVLTTGGTGLAPRDVTPEATRDVVDREVPNTPRAPLSRAVAGTVGATLVLNLPGSPGGAAECLGHVREAILHAVDLLAGGVEDCAGEGGPA